jgi:hypothetical protein
MYSFAKFLADHLFLQNREKYIKKFTGQHQRAGLEAWKAPLAERTHPNAEAEAKKRIDRLSGQHTARRRRTKLQAQHYMAQPSLLQ